MKREPLEIPAHVGHPQGNARLPTAKGFIEFLIQNRCSRYSIIHGVLGLNRLFRPPLHVEDLVTLALTQVSNQVLPKSGTGYLAPESLDIGTWFLEVDRGGCRQQVAIVREERNFEVAPEPCHQLSCPVCRPQRDNYLAEEVIRFASNENFWLTEVGEGDWPAMLRYIADNEPRYIIFPYSSHVLSNQKIKGARCVPKNTCKPVLVKLFSENDSIVTNDYACEGCYFPPRLRDSRSGNYWLPADRLTEIAVSLGAESAEIGKWYIPDTINILTWLEQFDQAVHSTQNNINHALESLISRERNRVLDELFMLGQYPRLFSSYAV